MAKLRGSITQLVKKQGYGGFIPGEDGCEVYFERTALQGIDLHSISIGQWVEYGVRIGVRTQAVDLVPTATPPTARATATFNGTLGGEVRPRPRGGDSAK